MKNDYYEFFPEQFAHSMPFFKGIWPSIILTYLIIEIATSVDYTRLCESSLVSGLIKELSSWRLVINHQGLVEEKIRFVDRALCVIPVFYLPMKGVIIFGVVLGVLSGQRKYRYFTDDHFHRSHTYKLAFFFFMGLLALFLGSGGDGEDTYSTEYARFGRFRHNFYYYVFQFVSVHVIAGMFMLYHVTFYYTALFLSRRANR